MNYINFHTHKSFNDKHIISIENVFPEDYLEGNYHSDKISVGIHPWFIQGDGQYQMQLMRTILSDQNVVFIGEAGLDKRQGGDFLRQESVFLEQIRLSEEFNKPLVIHCVKAYNEIISLRKKIKPSLPWIFHGFSSSVPVMEQALDVGFYFSYGVALLNDASKTVDTFCKTPLDRCFLETDEADMGIEILYQRAADLRGCEVAQIEDEMKCNFKLLLK